MRYLIEAPASYDDRKDRRRLLRAATNALGVAPGAFCVEGVRRTDDGTQIVLSTDKVDPRVFAHRQPLAATVGKGDGPRVAAVARRLTGQELVRFAPFDHEAILQDAPPLDIMVRDALARELRAEPHEVRVTIEHGDHAFLRYVHVHRAPGSPSKVGEALLEAVKGLRLPLQRHAEWRLTDRSLSPVASVISRVDPLRELLLAPPGPVGTTEITIGRSEAGEMLKLDLATMATSIAVQGQTRSGKSVFAYSVLSDLAAASNVIIAGVDPSSILLAPFIGTRHADWQVLGTSEPEKVEALLARLVAEMDRRTRQLVAETRDKFDTFDEQRPLFMVVLEEYPGLRRGIEARDKESGAGPSDRLLPKVDLHISRLLAEAAKVGIRVLVLAQRLDTTVLSGGDRSNIPSRLSFRVDRGDAVKMLHESIPEGLDVEDVRGFQPGVGLYESSVADQRVVRFRGSYAPGGYDDYVRRIRSTNPSTAPAPKASDFEDSEYYDEDLAPEDLGVILELTLEDLDDDPISVRLRELNGDDEDDPLLPL